MCVKGKLIIIGGAEDKDFDGHKGKTDGEASILQRVIKESRRGSDSRIEVITTASTVPDEVGDDYIAAFAALGAEQVGVLSITNRDMAAEESVLERIRNADTLFFSGGDQLRLTSILGGTPFFDVLSEKLDDPEFLYAGTSAGAAAASETMITEGKGQSALFKGMVKTTAGFGLIGNVVFDTHFLKRGRIGRLFQIIISNPKMLGVGLAENTGLLITSGKTMECIGQGMAIIVDGRSVRGTNLLEIEDGCPISVENLVLHVMGKGDRFDIENHTLEILSRD